VSFGFKLDGTSLKQGRSYGAVSWSRASADESLHYYGLSLFIAIMYFKWLTLIDFIIDFTWEGGALPLSLAHWVLSGGQSRSFGSSFRGFHGGKKCLTYYC